MSVNRWRLALLGGLGLLSASLASLAGCESVTNLDVRYDESLTADGGEGGVEGGGPSRVELEGCPCDEHAGLGCCIPATGIPFCTSSDSLCTVEARGVFARCLYPDPNSESLCCWHGTGTGAVAALAAACDGGPEACTRKSDCPGTVECKTRDCTGVIIGQCGTEAPACPGGPK